MELQTGNFVIYRSTEICRIEGFENKSFDNVTSKEYCVLVPADGGSARYYVPREFAEAKLRRLLTKDEIHQLIDGMKGEQPDWGNNEDHRKDVFNEILNSGDHRRIISMLHSLYLEKQERLAQGKKLLAADEKAMKAAEALIDHEFSFVLGIPQNEVAKYISAQLGKTE
ncbi:MAG: CarD family transcriptional regulator [Oscillospiraceae bacterium]|nr:CarD family transcriptional regulator [Oscillospiraceae bacterium]